MTPFSRSALGLLAGLLLGIAATVGGLSGFLLTLVLGAAGWALVGHLTGELDLTALARGDRRV